MSNSTGLFCHLTNDRMLWSFTTGLFHLSWSPARNCSLEFQNISWLNMNRIFMIFFFCLILFFLTKFLLMFSSSEFFRLPAQNLSRIFSPKNLHILSFFSPSKKSFMHTGPTYFVMWSKGIRPLINKVLEHLIQKTHFITHSIWIE